MELGIGGLGHATEIGAGASAIVYRARQIELDREVAVKVLSVTDDAFVRRFAREAKTLGKLSQNPGIVTVYDTGVTAAGQPYLILELCGSSVLDQLQSQGGSFDPIDACRAAAQVADAVSDAHANGVIHRDIKPGNVLRSQTGRYMVTDFGISTVTGTTMGQTNSIGFTAGYVAPETISGAAVGTPSDIYSVGATLFHMVAGTAAFVDTGGNSNLLALAQRVINDPVPDLRPQGVPDEVCRIIEGAMAKRPQDRPSGAQLRDQLEAVVDDMVTLSAIGAGRPATGPSTTGPSTTGPSTTGPSTTGPSTTGPSTTGPSTTGPSTVGAGLGGSAPEARPAPAGSHATRIDDGAIGAAVFTGDATSLVRSTIGDSPPGNGAADSPIGEHRWATTPGSATGYEPTGHPVDAGWSTDGAAGSGRLGDAGPADPEGRILSDLPTGPQASESSEEADRRYAFTVEDRRMSGPLIGGAVIALLVLLGVGGYLISRAGGGDDGDGDGGVKIETAAGPGTTLSARGNESTGQGTGGGRGRLEANPISDDDLDGTIDPVSTVIVPNVVRTVAIPSLSGQTRSEADAALKALDLMVSPTATRAFHPTVDAGLVVGSTPAVGTTVNLHSVVALILSDGPDPGLCSDVAGLSESVATSRLEGRNLTVSSTRRSSSTVPSGNVVSCTRTETTASLVVSTGPDVCGGVIGSDRAQARADIENRGYSVTETGRPSNAGPVGQVFDCQASGTSATITYVSAALPTQCNGAVGRTVPQARAFLQDQGFTDIVVASTNNITVPDGEVISCAVAGSTATLTVSDGPPKVKVPDVVGLRRAGGFAALMAAGLEPGGPQEVVSQKPRGEIVATQPAAGASVAPGSVVTVVISGGPAAQVDVPPVIGLTQAAGAAAITSAGLTPAFTTRELPKGDPDIGHVVAVNPPTGTTVVVGSTVTLTIGTAG